MKFIKGKSGNPNGKPAGKPNKSTIEFKVALNNLLEFCAPEMVKWLNLVALEDPSKALEHMARLAEFVYPKLARSDNTTTLDGKVAITWPLPKTGLDV